VAAVFPDPIEVGAEMLPACPGSEVSREVLAELPWMGTTVENPETRIVEELTMPEVEAEPPELPGELSLADERPELLPCGIVAPDEPRFEIETGLENEGDTLGGLEDPNADVN
jgi:hypothetical protein